MVLWMVAYHHLQLHTRLQSGKVLKDVNSDEKYKTSTRSQQSLRSLNYACIDIDQSTFA